MYQFIAFFVLASALMIEGRKTRHVVYWDCNQTPALNFDGLEVDVNVDDYMDVLCPNELGLKQPWKPQERNPYLELFNVTLEDYLACDISRGRRLQRCDNPGVEKKLTTKFQVRSPSPLGFKFIPGMSYYYISKPIADKSKGCSKETMRMRINVKKIGEEPPKRHHEKTRTYHTLKTDHRNSSNTAGLHPLFRNKPSDKVEPSKRHHHHNKLTQSTTSGTKEFFRKKAPEPVLRASQGPKRDGGNAASSLRNSRRTFNSLITLVISSLGTLVTCALLTDFEFVRSRRS